MAKDWAEYFPIQEITSDTLVNGNGDITAGWSLRLPEVYTLEDTDYVAAHDEQVKLIKRLGVGNSITFQHFVYTSKYRPVFKKSAGPIAIEDQKYFSGRELVRHYANCYVTFSNDTLTTVNANRNSFVRGLNYVFGRPFKDTAKTIKNYLSDINGLDQNLNMLPGMAAKRMSNEQLRCALYDYFSLSYNNPCLDAKDKTLPLLEVEDGYLRIGDQFVAVLSLVKEGDLLWASQVNPTKRTKFSAVPITENIGLNTSMVYPLTLGLPFDHIYTVAISILDNERFQSFFEKKIRNELNLLAMLNVPAAQIKIDEIKKTIHEIETSQYQCCRTAVNVIINDSEMSRLKDKVVYATTAFAKMNDSGVWNENAEAGNLFFATAPGNTNKNYRVNYQTVNQAISYIPKETQYFSDPRGVVVFDRMGDLKVVDLNDPEKVVNPHMVVFGPSGAGKSVALNYFINQFLAAGQLVLIIDIGDSYKRICELNNGYYYDAGKKENLSFNIFICERDEEGKWLYNKGDKDGEGTEDTVNFVYSVVSKLWKGSEKISNEQKAILKELIIEFYKHINEQGIFPDLNSFHGFIDKYLNEILDPLVKKKEYLDFQSLKLCLSPYVTGGQYETLLNAKQEFVLQNVEKLNMIVFELKAIAKNEDICEIVFLIVIRVATLISSKVTDRLKFIPIDEAIDFLKGDFGEYIGGAFRKERKNGGRMCIATQGIKYLNAIDPLVKDSILGNCDIKILLNHRNEKASYPEFKKSLSFTDFDTMQLDSMVIGDRFREILMKFGYSPAKVFRIDLSYFSEGVFTTFKPDLNRINQLYKEIGNLGSAINCFIEEKYGEEIRRKEGIEGKRKEVA